MQKPVTILGIETSCDETSAAVLCDGQLRSNIISSQSVHQQYGGVVPELASRAHQKNIIPIVEQALRDASIEKEDITAVAAAIGPGLMGSLLVGVNFGKALAYGAGIPFIGVNHMEAHLYSNFLEEPVPVFPFVNLTVSGGHTQLVLAKDDFQYIMIGETRDDAAGEAFDKVAKMLGLEYPGGPQIDALAKQGDPESIDFPRPYLSDDEFGFSFSGIKTSVLYYLRDRHHRSIAGSTGELIPLTAEHRANICASFQAAIVDVLVTKTAAAAKKWNVGDIAVAGGVSANSALRHEMRKAAEENGLRLFIPKLEYCTDNGAMVAEVGYRKYLHGIFSPLTQTAVANLDLPV